MPRTNLPRAARTVHLYFGIFITPAILFFALSGALQSFGLHETNGDHPDYKPARWMALLAQIHKKQTSVVPVKRPLPAPALKAPTAPAPVVAPAATQSMPHMHNPLPLRVFFVIVCLGLFTSTLTGLYMTWRFNRNRLLVGLTLAFGIAVPLVLLFV